METEYASAIYMRRTFQRIKTYFVSLKRNLYIISFVHDRSENGHIFYACQNTLALDHPNRSDISMKYTFEVKMSPLSGKMVRGSSKQGKII